MNDWIIACDDFDTGIGSGVTNKIGIIATSYQSNTFVNERGFRSTISNDGQARFYITSDAATYASDFTIGLTIQWMAYIIE